MHGPAGWMQSQPIPFIAVTVSPAGAVSLTVTVFPAVFGPVPPFVTVTEYVAPACPCEKLPLCVFAIVRSGPGTV